MGQNDRIASQRTPIELSADITGPEVKLAKIPFAGQADVLELWVARVPDPGTAPMVGGHRKECSTGERCADSHTAGVRTNRHTSVVQALCREGGCLFI